MPAWLLLSVVLSVVLSCLSLWSCYLIARSGHHGTPWVPSGGPIPDPQEGGGDFSKRGEGQTETNPVPIFMREVKKNVVFQRKNVGNGENLRKRKTRKRKRGVVV